jgi:hypothetical protein
VICMERPANFDRDIWNGECQHHFVRGLLGRR